MSLFDSYDPVMRAVLNPDDVFKPVDGFPQVVLVTFRQAILDIALEEFKCEKIGVMESGGDLKIYKFADSAGGKQMAIYRTTMGAAMTVALMEEVIAMGGKKFVFFGSCGTLDRTIKPGQLIVPTAAYRDEGTSYHYIPCSAGDYVQIHTSDKTFESLKKAGFDAQKTKVWTTDGLYRETKANMDRRVAEGCRVVDMECSAIMAAAAFRQVEAYHFLYGEDNLDDTVWDPRTMGKVPQRASHRYLMAALEIGKAI